MAKSIALILLFTFICNLNFCHHSSGPRSVEAANKQRRKEENKNQHKRPPTNEGRRKTKETGPDDPYKILGVKKTAKDKEIKSAYRKLALKYHVSCIYSLLLVSCVC